MWVDLIKGLNTDLLNLKYHEEASYMLSSFHKIDVGMKVCF